MGGKITPSAVLVISNDQLVNVKSDSINKIIDMVPDFIDKISKERENLAESSYWYGWY